MNNVTEISKYKSNTSQYEVLDQAIQKGLLFSTIEMEYKRGAKNFYTNGDGRKGFSLSASYYKHLEFQLDSIRNRIIIPIINKLNCSFVIVFEVSQKGEILSDHVKLSLQMECPKRLPYLETVEEVFNVLMPFTDYISNLEVNGHSRGLSYIRAEMNISREDLMDTILNPYVDEFIEKQWHDFGIIAYHEAKEQFSLNVRIPFTYGAFTWDTIEKSIRITQQETLKELMNI